VSGAQTPRRRPTESGAPGPFRGSQNLHAPFARNHHVLRFEIAVNQTRGVRGRETVGDLCSEVNDFAQWQRPILKTRAQRRPLDELGHQKLSVCCAPDIEHAEDVG
jgi:hypothetical protein